MKSFIAYRALPHLNNKHTIFARLIDDPSSSSTTLSSLESAPVDSSTTNKPTPPIRILNVTIFVNPFEEFLKQKQEGDEAINTETANNNKTQKRGTTRKEDDERTTWTGKRIRGTDSVARGKGNDDGGGGGVGKYLKAALANQGQEEDEIIEVMGDEEMDPEPEHVRKKAKAGKGGFGNFDSW